VRAQHRTKRSHRRAELSHRRVAREPAEARAVEARRRRRVGGRHAGGGRARDGGREVVHPERDAVHPRPRLALHQRMSRREHGERAAPEGEHRHRPRGARELATRQAEVALEDRRGGGGIVGDEGHVGDLVGEHHRPSPFTRIAPPVSRSMAGWNPRAPRRRGACLFCHGRAAWVGADRDLWAIGSRGGRRPRRVRLRLLEGCARQVLSPPSEGRRERRRP